MSSLSVLDQCGATQRRLLEVLLQNPEGMGVDGLVSALNVSANAVRQHLAALERDQFIERRQAETSRGRPQHLYTLTNEGKEAFPRQYRELAENLIIELADLLGEDQLADAMQRMGQRTAQQATNGKTLSIQQTAGFMHQVGYEASTQNDSQGNEEIVAMNCVFHQLAEQHASVCEFDLALMGKATGMEVEHRECMVRGGQFCRFGFPPKAQS